MSDPGLLYRLLNAVEAVNYDAFPDEEIVHSGVALLAGGDPTGHRGCATLRKAVKQFEPCHPPGDRWVP